MIKNKLGKSDYTISKIGLGTVQFGLDYGFTKKKSQEEVNNILNSALKNKINFLDTAREYGDSEEKIGNFINNYDNDFIIATKIKNIDDLYDLNYSKLKKHIFNSVEESSKYLNLNKISILQLHQINELIYKNVDFWNVINELIDDNLIGSFGVSVYGLEECEYIIKHFNNYIDFFQIPYNIFDRRFDRIQKLLNSYSIDLISRSTFLKGIIPCSLNNLPTELKNLSPYKTKLNNIAKSLNMNLDELAILFVYYNNNIKSTIFGVDSPEELEKNVKSINNFNKNIFEDINLDELKIDDINLIDPRKWHNFQ